MLVHTGCAPGATEVPPCVHYKFLYFLLAPGAHFPYPFIYCSLFTVSIRTHYENTPIQIYRIFHLLKTDNFSGKKL